MADDDERDPLNALAAAVLRRLRLDGGGRLLDLTDTERERLGACFRALAIGGLVARGLPREEVRRAERYAPLLVERAFEETGALPESAAAYALAHDERLEREDARSRYELAALRFKLGHTLFLLGEHEAANLERCTAFGRETAALLERLEGSGEGPREAVRLLAMELQGWLGGRYEALGRLGPAAAAFLAASGAAATADDRVAFAVRAAAAMIAAGRAREAERVLDAVRDDVPALRSNLSRRLWEATHASLSGTMPGQRLSDRVSVQFAALRVSLIEVIDLEALHAALNALSAVELAVVFGSSARGRSGPRSDVDLALRLAPDVPETRREVVAAARAAVLREIDDVDLDAAPPLLRLQIARHGLLLVEREPRSWTEFKARAMTDWWDWAPTARRIQAVYIRRLREQTAHGGA